MPSEMKRLRLPEEENTRPKRLVVNSSLDKKRCFRRWFGKM
jgi:hypothetical protein